jgi:type IV pilus assembly protein PilE
MHKLLDTPFYGHNPYQRRFINNFTDDLNKGVRGFSLMELLITVTIIGILAAIAIPSYNQYIKRANRADAKSALLMNAQYMERNFTESNLYNKTDSDNDGVFAENISLPYTQSPIEGTAIYNITLSASSTAYTLSATPVSGGSMAGDVCGALTLTNLGVKGVGGGTVPECWNQ